MLTMKQWVESCLAAALREYDLAKQRYEMLEKAATAIENGKAPGLRIVAAYNNWLGLQPKEPRP